MGVDLYFCLSHDFSSLEFLVLGHCNGLALVATVTRWLKATGSLDDLKEMKRCLGSGTRLVYYLILLNLKVLST